MISSSNDGEHIIESNNLDNLFANYSCAFLQDNDQNKVIDLFVEEKYSFESEAGTSNRFNLILSHSYESCQELIENPTVYQKIAETIKLRGQDGTWYVDYTLGNEITQMEINLFLSLIHI